MENQETVPGHQITERIPKQLPVQVMPRNTRKVLKLVLKGKRKKNSRRKAPLGMGEKRQGFKIEIKWKGSTTNTRLFTSASNGVYNEQQRPSTKATGMNVSYDD